MWCGFFACSMSILNSTPFKYIIPTIICGFTGIVVRDLLQNQGLSSNWSTMFAAFTIVIMAGIIIRSKYVPPIVLICAVLPQWASVAMFNMLDDLRKVSISTGDQLNKAAIDLCANFANVILVSIVIAIGFAIGIGLLKVVYKEADKTFNS